MRKLAPLLGILVLIGCAKPEDSTATKPAAPPVAQSDGIAPIGSGALGGMTPVTGAESVGGGGFGGGGVAKDMARGAAGAAGSGSLGQAGEAGD